MWKGLCELLHVYCSYMPPLGFPHLIYASPSYSSPGLTGLPLEIHQLSLGIWKRNDAPTFVARNILDNFSNPRASIPRNLSKQLQTPSSLLSVSGITTLQLRKTGKISPQQTDRHKVNWRPLTRLVSCISALMTCLHHAVYRSSRGHKSK